MQHSAGKEWKLVEPIVINMGYELVGVEFITGQSPAILRVYIDKEDGVTIKDCESVSRQISAVFDVEDPITEVYNLEVSTPGLDRPLFKESDFVQYAGHVVKIKLSIPFEERRNFKGVLTGVEDSMIVIVVDNLEYLLPFEQIEKANVIAQFEKGEKKKF